MGASPHLSFVGRYCLYRPLATGGTATIFLGCLRAEGGFSRAVAIKKLHAHLADDERVRESLLTEARIVSRIRHPNVAAVLDVVSEGADAIVVLEYVHGESLSQLVRNGDDAVPPAVAARIMIDALEGLHAAHEASNDQGAPLLVVHRDVSPQNVMVDLDGRARVVDFGVAKALERPYTTEEGQFRGKLAYASPEQITTSRVDRRTDVFAAGLVLWELLTGRRMFEGAEPGAIVNRLTHDTSPFAAPSSLVPAVPAAMDAIVARALERDPDARYQTARQMALALEKTGPAESREVAKWVAQRAKARLQARARFIDEMEAELRRSDLPVAATSATSGEPDTTLPVAREVAEPAPLRTRAAWAAMALIVVGAAVATSRILPREEAPRLDTSTTHAVPVAVATSVAPIGAVPPPLPSIPPTASTSSTPSTSSTSAPATSVVPPLARGRNTVRPTSKAHGSPRATPSARAPSDPLRMDERQ